MDKVVGDLLSIVLSGGPHAVVACLGLAIIGMIVDRRRMIADQARLVARMDALIDQYHTGNVALAQAMTSVKDVLTELRIERR